MVDTCAWCPTLATPHGTLSGTGFATARHSLLLPSLKPLLKQSVRKERRFQAPLRCHFESGSNPRSSAGGGCPFHSGASGAPVTEFEPTTVFKTANVGSFEESREWRQKKSEAKAVTKADVRDLVEQDLGIPGPRPWNLFENIVDLSHIAIHGIEEAVLHYSRKYGPLCR